MTNTTPRPALDETSLNALARQQQQANRSAASAVAARLTGGYRVSAEQLYDGLRASVLLHWWELLTRYGHQHRLGIVRAMARFSFWVSCYRTQDLHDDTPPDGGRDGVGDKDLALAHLDCALELIKRAAARDFLDTAASNPTAGREQQQ
ncbi:hypothetical protein GCM10009850_087650 [Nonomuraea monospora]|uniref:Uncharacterized protein n=1 Tax=Nonomuraea monospora TaxID=568818 RepID=A0ABP5PR95_9ACTN